MADVIRAAMQEAEASAIMAIKAMLATVLTEATKIVILAGASTIMAVTIAFATIIIPTTSTAVTLADSETVVEPALEADRIPVAAALAAEAVASEAAVAQVAAALVEEDSRFYSLKLIVYS